MHLFPFPLTCLVWAVDDPSVAIALVAGATAVVALLAALPQISKESRREGRTIEDSEAAVRHFLPV